MFPKKNSLLEETTTGKMPDKLIDYQKSEFKKYWMPDSTGKECYECYEQFSAFRRKHHCRLCGQIFCGKCSNRQINGADLGLFLFYLECTKSEKPFVKRVYLIDNKIRGDA